MLYKFDNLYIGTITKKTKNGIIYCGEILCSTRNELATDLLNGESYKMISIKDFEFAEYGRVYVSGLNENFPKHYLPLVITKKALIEMANELNESWTNINIPEEAKARTLRKKTN